MRQNDNIYIWKISLHIRTNYSKGSVTISAFDASHSYIWVSVTCLLLDYFKCTKKKVGFNPTLMLVNRLNEQRLQQAPYFQFVQWTHSIHWATKHLAQAQLVPILELRWEFILFAESRHFCTKIWWTAILNAASGELVIGRVDFQINFIILWKLNVAGYRALLQPSVSVPISFLW